MPTPRTGTLTLLAVLAFGGLFVAGLYFAAYLIRSPDYRASLPGLPSRPVRVATWNLDWKTPPAAVVETLRPLAPDFVLLQRLTRADAQSIAAGLDLRADGQLQMYYSPSNPNSDPAEPGNAILSRHPLHQGRTIPKPNYVALNVPNPPDGFGVFAEPVLDGRRFLLASVDFTPDAGAAERLSLLNAVEKAGSPPLVLAAAGDVPTDPPDARRLHTAVPTTQPTAAPRQALLLSDDWQATPVATPAPGPSVFDLAAAESSR